MYTQMMRIGMVFGTLWAFSVGSRALEVVPPAAASEIVLKQTAPARVAFLEHTGPYWTVGPLFKQVREAMAENNETGPMFARYLADPTAVPAESLQSEVGFEIHGDWQPVPPLAIAQREGEQVVSIVVEGSYGTTARSYSLLRDWILRNGFEAVGPLIELYPLPPRGAAPVARRTEIQIPVRPASSTGSTTPESGISGQGPGGDKSVAVQPPTPNLQPPTPEPQPIQDLVDSSRFDRIAEQLVPTDRPMPVGMQLWLGQVIFRINAVAKGIEQTCPGASPHATVLSEAIVRRYRQATSSSKIDPLAQAVVRVDTHTDPQSAQKRLIIRDLDNLLGQVAVKTIDAESAFDCLTDILQRVQDLQAP